MYGQRLLFTASIASGLLLTHMHWCMCRAFRSLVSSIHAVLAQAAISMLKQEYKEGETNLNDALKLAVKVLSKTLDTNKLSSERVSLFRNNW